MPTAPKTAKAIDAATLQHFGEEERRRHLGASIIGGKCGRKIYYKFRWAKTKNLTGTDEDGECAAARLKRLFNRGHRQEDVFIALLRRAGVTVYDAGESGEMKESLRISDVDGHFGGTPDGVGYGIPDIPNVYALLEFKTANDKQFQRIKADGVMTAKWEYFVQMQVYMEKHGLPVALFMTTNKNDDELYLELVHANSEQGQHYINRARDIIYAKEPPPRIANSPGQYPCKWCDFKDLCYFPGQNFPEINCRTCVHAVPTNSGNGSWSCARGRGEIADQGGCKEHLYDPTWFDGWSVLDGDFDANWLKIDDGVSTFKMGPHITGYTSEDLFRDGLIPF